MIEIQADVYNRDGLTAEAIAIPIGYTSNKQ
jgi:hypothetical protein